MPNFQEIAAFVNTVPGTASRPDYAEALYQRASCVKNPKLAVEIGSYVGGSSICIGHAFKGTGAKLLCIEPRFLEFTELMDRKEILPANELAQSEFQCVSASGFYFNKFLAYRKQADLENVLVPMPGFSDDVFNKWKPEPLDFLYVDGAHTYEAVKLDCRFMDYIVPGGYALFDDWITDVEKAVKEYMSNHPGWILVDDLWPRFFQKRA